MLSSPSVQKQRLLEKQRRVCMFNLKLKANKNLFLVVLILDYTSLVYMNGCVMKNDFQTVYELQHKCMLRFFLQKLTYKMNYFSGYGLPRFSKDLTSEFQLKPEVPAIVCSKMYCS